MSIEIFNNTLIKLIARQGTNPERLNIIPSSGEFAFTTDTERLFIGNGSDFGGVLVGNKFKGSGPDITVFSPCEIGDQAYNTDSDILFRVKENDGSLITDWEAIGGKGMNSDIIQAQGGIKIDNLVRVTSTEWSTLSISNDPNTFYIVSDTNYIIA